jgi:CBS domain-containing protein
VVLISDILRSKGSDVVTVTPDTTVESLIGMLAEHRIGALVVSADAVTVHGIVSERDIVRALAARGTSVLAETVDQICTHDVVTAAPTSRVAELMHVMTEGRFRHVPVVVDGRLQGIVSIGDVIKSGVTELESEREALTNYIESG